MPISRTFKRRRGTALALVAMLVVAPLVAALSLGNEERVTGDRDRSSTAADVRIMVLGKPLLRVPAAQAQQGRTAVRRWLDGRLPRSLALRRGGVSATMRPELAITARRVVAALPSRGRVRLAARLVATEIRAPVIEQAQRNSCESAALSILLAATGRPVDQNRLQRELPRSGPLDPVEQGGVRVWGDPNRGYVGRPDGGGVAGGFGVYQGPVSGIAARHGRPMVDLSGMSPESVYRRVREGRPVMVWVGLSDGPYGKWRSPSGRTIAVNFGEHTVVINGIRADGSLRVVNPLTAQREVWSRSDFERMWERLGRRALTPALSTRPSRA